MARTTEGEIADVVEQILQDRPNGEASIRELICEIPRRIQLSSDDLAPSPTRNGEAIWEQQVRNIPSHKNSPGNAIYEGRLESIRGGLRLRRLSVAVVVQQSKGCPSRSREEIRPVQIGKALGRRLKAAIQMVSGVRHARTANQYLNGSGIRNLVKIVLVHES